MQEAYAECHEVQRKFLQIEVMVGLNTSYSYVVSIFEYCPSIVEVNPLAIADANPVSTQDVARFTFEVQRQ